MTARHVCAFAAVILGGFLSLTGGAAHGTSGAQSGWSAARPLGSCVVAVGPRVAFPSESPSLATGPGAIVWVEDPVCASASARPPRFPFGLSVAALSPGGRTAFTHTQALHGAPAGELGAVGASRGRLAVGASLGARGTSPAVALWQGRATGPLESGPLLSGTGRLFSLAHAYLGDAAVATVQPGVAIEVRVERYFRSRFEQPRRIAIGAEPVSALAATMDYRSDVLVAWQQNGAIYAHMLRASGRAEPTQRVGTSAPNPQLKALVSDNDHGMIAWSSAGGGARAASTSVRIAFSEAGVRFAGSRLVASFVDPEGAGHAPGSLALARLSTENVMLAWTDAEAGHYVVRAAPAVFAGTRPAARLSDPAGQSRLADLAPGPAGEAVALWSSTHGGSGIDPTRNELWAARAFVERHGRVGAGPAEIVASAGPNADPSLAVDPASDHAVAAWLTLAAHPSIEWAAGPGASGYRPGTPAAAAHPGSGTHSLRIALAAGAVAIVALMILALRRRAGARAAGGANRGMRRRR
ncbi:MAG TPA: hypothetical protein VGW98_11955 [Solirubrobacteraceae bacterium]|nr:hypothetical protein [Solirubrobacteraceae bacterium]